VIRGVCKPVERRSAGRSYFDTPEIRGSWIGDWLNYGEGRPKWGDKYEKAVEEFGLDARTLEKYKAVSARIQFPLRRGNLSWTHHQALAYQPADVRKKLLAEAVLTVLPASTNFCSDFGNES